MSELNSNSVREKFFSTSSLVQKMKSVMVRIAYAVGYGLFKLNIFHIKSFRVTFLLIYEIYYYQNYSNKL